MDNIIIEFRWRNKTIRQYISKKEIFKDIKEEDNFWGEFTIGNDIYQYQIWWNSGEIAIFYKGATDYCAIVEGFTAFFNHFN